MIFKYDFRYSIARLFVNAAFRLNFRKLVFVGLDKNMPTDKPIILTPNHRNALLDALMLVYSSRPTKQVVFLARADIFKKKFIAWLLRGMRIMPVYRIRDGKENLSRNDEIFESAGKVLKNKMPLALFPEARHNPKQSLLPIQKAAPRIIMPTEAQYNFELDSQIVPVAIYYRQISAFLTDAYVTFGEPIAVADYKAMYAENPNLAINHLRQDMEERMKQIVVNISNDEFYQEYLDAIDWNAEMWGNTKFSGRKDSYLQGALGVVRRLDDMFANNRSAFDAKMKQLREAKKHLSDFGLRTTDNLWTPKSTTSLFVRALLLVLTLPLALCGFINAIFPILINKKLLSMFKDNQFVASVRYVSGLVFVPLFALVQALIVGGVSGNWWWALGYFVAMPLAFLFAIHWRRRAKEWSRQRKVSRFVSANSQLWNHLKQLISL